MVQASYLWFFIVPVAAKLLVPIAGDHKVPLPPYQFNVTVSCPPHPEIPTVKVIPESPKTMTLNIGLPFK